MFLCDINNKNQSFNSRPHKEVDHNVLYLLISRFPFNSRPHKEVDCGVMLYAYKSVSFNSRPHKEVDHYHESGDADSKNFQFTTSQGGRRLIDSIHRMCKSFQFTTSQGGRPARPVPHGSFCSFNSRPHKEVDRNATR